MENEKQPAPQISKEMNDAINQLDALETYHELSAKTTRSSFYEQEAELIEKLKVSLRALRDKELGL